MNPVYELRVAQLKECQRQISGVDTMIKKRDNLLVLLHRDHGVRQADLSAMLMEAADEVGGSGVSESGVFKAIKRQLGHSAGRVSRQRVLP